MNTEQLKRKIARQQAQQDNLFKRQVPTTFKKRTRITYSRNTLWLPINHARTYYTHVKYAL